MTAPVNWTEFVFIVGSLGGLTLGALRWMWLEFRSFRSQYEIRHDDLRKELDAKIENHSAETTRRLNGLLKDH